MQAPHAFPPRLLPMTLAAALLALPMAALAQTAATPPASQSGPARAALMPLLTTTGDATVMLRPRLSQLLGTTIYNERDEKIGEVEDVLLFPAPGAPPVAVASRAPATPPASGTVPGTPATTPAPMASQAPAFSSGSTPAPTTAPAPAAGAATAARAGSVYPLAVLEVGGFLGMGGRLVTVPLADLQWNASNEHIILPGVTKEMLESRPAFQYSGLQVR